MSWLCIVLSMMTSCHPRDAVSLPAAATPCFLQALSFVVPHLFVSSPPDQDFST
uniref:Nicotinate phosphoribosyltransferase n=1 Tax=Phakopsora pachyrhizi TaxID=170000 RepID=A0A0S1MIL3_PHAPC